MKHLYKNTTKMKKRILSAAMFLAIASVINAQDTKTAATMTAAQPAENKNQAEFKFELEEYNYGNIKQGENVSYEFVFTNVGKEPLVITSAAGSCGCTVPEWPKEPIKKGEKGKIKITFNSAGKQGMQDKTVTINSNAITNPKILHIKGNVEMPPATPTEAPKN